MERKQLISTSWDTLETAPNITELQVCTVGKKETPSPKSPRTPPDKVHANRKQLETCGTIATGSLGDWSPSQEPGDILTGPAALQVHILGGGGGANKIGTHSLNKTCDCRNLVHKETELRNERFSGLIRKLWFKICVNSFVRTDSFILYFWNKPKKSCYYWGCLIFTF